MACETAVVATAVGGIKEVVVDGETGFLVPIDQMEESPFEPRDPEKFARDLAGRINQVDRESGALREVRASWSETRGGEVQLGGDRRADANAL